MLCNKLCINIFMKIFIGIIFKINFSFIINFVLIMWWGEISLFGNFKGGNNTKKVKKPWSKWNVPIVRN